MVQTLTGCTDFGVPVGTYFGDGIRKGSDPLRCGVRGRIPFREERALTPAAGRASSTTTRCVAGYSFMFRPTNTLRPGAGENIGRALSQKKLSYQA